MGEEVGLVLMGTDSQASPVSPLLPAYDLSSGNAPGDRGGAGKMAQGEKALSECAW